MKINKRIFEFKPEKIEILDFDLVLASSGYERRSTHIERIYKIKCPTKIAIGFENHVDHPDRIENDLFFKQSGYKIISASGNNDEEVRKVLETIGKDKKELNILIDYSSMTRIWYSGVLNHFNELEDSSLERVNLYFSYSHSSYVAPPNITIPNKHVSPIHNYFTISSSQKPTSLIIGLGNESVRAFGLMELFDAETFLFYTDTAGGNRFSIDVERNNLDLIKLTPQENTIKYSISQLEYLHFILNGLCSKLVERSKIIIAPCGPKPFTLISLVNSFLTEDTTVWRISPGEEGVPECRDANGEVLLTLIQFNRGTK